MRDSSKSKQHASSHTLKLLDGIIKRHPDGFGFFIPDDTEHPDVYIARHDMVGVMTNDRVSVKVHPSKDLKRLSGEIIQVLKHAATHVIGKFKKLRDGYGVIKDEESSWGSDLQVRDTMKANDGDLVAIKIKTFPGDKLGFTGDVSEVLGAHGDPLTDTKRVIFNHGIPMEFTPETLKEAKKLPLKVDLAELKNRKDLRDLPFITIDGATAKDFDDAICVEASKTGFHLWVAIADVSHYVDKGSAMDKDAYVRGNSTYFPHFVVPMLPEELSNELCSLKPHVPRLAVVADMLLSFQGDIEKCEFYEAVIESRHRVTYGEAQDVIDGAGEEKLSDVKPMILKATELAKILMAKRFREGSLDLDIPDTQITLDDGGNPTDIVRTERLFAHKLIEELMLISNVAVAEFFRQKHIPAIYRVHDTPSADNIKNLENYIFNFGGKTKSLVGGKLQKKLTQALKEFEGKPEATILNILTLRCMKQAEYKAENIGHFGLGFANYTHFTSPIRRYSDLIVHRLLKSIILKSRKYQPMSEEELATAGTNLSACEQRSTKAERQFQSIKRARFIAKFVGQEFDGIISSVARFGIFVLLRAYDVDGLVKVDALGDDRFDYHEDILQLIGRRTKHTYKIGDQIKVQVVRADADVGQIDFALADAPKLGGIRSKQKEILDQLDRKIGNRENPQGGRDKGRGQNRNQPRSNQKKKRQKKSHR